MCLFEMDRRARRSAGVSQWGTILLFFLVARGGGGQASEQTKLHPLSVSSAEYEVCTKSHPLMNPLYEVRHGVDVVWQIPPNPKAVLFIAHGGSKKILSFFDPGPDCTRCYGFPEDRVIVLDALRRGYAVILVQSVDGHWGQPYLVSTWPYPMTQDRINVRSILEEWTREHSLEHLPLVAFGHSAGGWFSSVLTLDIDLKSVVQMCSDVQTLVMEHADKALFPPVLFMPMPIDDSISPAVMQTFNIMKSKEFITAVFEIWPRPISPRLFADQIPCIDERTSENIFSALKVGGWLDENDYQIVNPTESDWRSQLKEQNVLPFCEASNDLCWAGHVEQELNAAFGFHSLTSWADKALFGWLDWSLTRGANSSETEGQNVAFS